VLAQPPEQLGEEGPARWLHVAVMGQEARRLVGVCPALASVPEVGAENRVTCDGRLGVYRTQDGGSSWELLTDGLPQRAWGAVMREGFSSDRLDPPGIYLGAQSGSLFVSADAGGSWLEAVAQLPPILSVEAAEWP